MCVVARSKMNEKNEHIQFIIKKKREITDSVGFRVGGTEHHRVRHRPGRRRVKSVREMEDFTHSGGGPGQFYPALALAVVVVMMNLMTVLLKNVK